MSKLLGKQRAAPLLHPSPDFKNRSKIQGTVSPVKQVKLYLEHAKQNHKQNRGFYFEPVEEQLKYSSNQEILRKRITELQLQNNQFRSYAKDYEQLAERNRSLQAQMLLLLDELEGNSIEENPLSHQRRLTGKDQNNTTESSHQHSTHHPHTQQEESSGNYKHSPNSQEIKIVKAFDSYEQQELIEQNAHLKAENQRIQTLIDNSIREAIVNLQQKFFAYIASMQEKLEALAAVNQQVALMRNDDGSSKSSKENQMQIQWRRPSFQKEGGSDCNYAQSQNSGFSLNPRKTYQLQSGQDKPKEQDQSSKVDIQLSYLSESHSSFGNSNRKAPHATPNSFFKNIQFVDSQLPPRALFEESTVEQAFQQLASLRTHLSSIFSLRAQNPSLMLQQAERNIEAELRQLLATYFPATELSALEQQNAFLRKKVAQMSSQMGQAHSPSDIITPNSKHRPASQLYLQQSYYLSLDPQPYLEFEQSKRKLSEVIDIVRSFNKDYRHLLSESSRGSLLLQSVQKDHP